MLVLAGVLISVLASSQANPLPRIVNGTNATEGEFPFMVSIRMANGTFHTCGGTIIGKRWILTAGHCLSTGLSSVRFGTVVRNEGGFEPDRDIKIAKQVGHPDYLNDYIGGEWVIANDIALLELTEDLPYGPTVQPATLPEQDAVVPANESAVLIGWGYLSGYAVEKPEILQKVDLTIYGNEYCDEFLTVPYNNTQNICAGVPANDKGQCTGDSGGPLLVDGVPTGIVSWSVKPCISAPGAFTRISFYRNWIRSVTGIYNGVQSNIKNNYMSL